MVKKALALILILILVLAFTACGSKAKWPLAEGVWVETSAGQVTYVCMEKADGADLFTMGVDGSDFFVSGPVTDIHKISDGLYDFTVADGTETLNVTCELTDQADGVLYMNFNGGGQARFRYAVPSLDEFDAAEWYE